MKKYLIFILLWLLHAQVSLGNTTTELLGSLAHAKGDSQKVEAYITLMRHFSLSSADSFNLYAEQALTYCKQRKYRLGEGKLMAQLAITDANQGRVNIALQRNRQALEIYKEQNFGIGIADVLGNIGALEAQTGKFDTGITYMIAAVRVNESIKNDNGLMIAYMNIGSVYLQLNDTTNATKFLTLAEEVSKRLPLSDKMLALYNMIGVVYAVKGNTAKALEYFLNDLKLSDRAGFASSHVESLLYLGNFYNDMGDVATSLKYLREGLKIASEKNMTEMKGNLLMEIATMIKDKDPAMAMEQLKEAEAICHQSQNRAFLVNVYKEMADLYKMQGKYKEALEVTEYKQKIADSIFTMNRASEMASIAATYELEKTMVKVNDLEILSKRTASQRNTVILIAIVIAVLMVILWRVYRKTIVLNKQLKAHEEELKELNNTKDKFFSIIGHDLRSPIAVVPTILDLLEDEQTTEDEKRYLMDSMREHSKSSMEMLDKLLFWGQSLVKGIMLQEQNIYLKEFISENIALKKIAAANKGIQIKDNVPADLLVHADATHCDFIVRNLLSNAIKYTYENGVIEISSDRKMRPGFTVFSIKDNGMGIDKDVLPNIFNPQYSVTGTANEKGTGIGLMLCKEFAIQNGGDIWVESEAGKGATFYFAMKNAA